MEAVIKGKYMRWVQPRHVCHNQAEKKKKGKNNGSYTTSQLDDSFDSHYPTVIHRWPTRIVFDDAVRKVSPYNSSIPLRKWKCIFTTP